MISKYFSNKNSLDLIEDPIKQNNGSDYWYLQNKNNQECCWNTGVFSDDDIELIKVIGRRLGVDRSYTYDSGKNCLDHRRSYNSWIHQNEYTNWIYERLTDLIIENNNLFFNFDLTMIEKLQFTYYNSKENGCYKSHVDPISWNLPHNRKLSIVVQLSDPNEYEGGEINLYYSNNPITIKKEKGHIISFPSYVLHEVTPVTKGERYSLVVWVHGPSFK